MCSTHSHERSHSLAKATNGKTSKMLLPFQMNRHFVPVLPLTHSKMTNILLELCRSHVYFNELRVNSKLNNVLKTPA